MSKKIKIIVSLMISIFFIVFFSLAMYTRNKYEEIYNEGVSYLELGKYKEAVNCFKEIPDYIKYQNISELLDDYPVCPYCGSVLE